LVISYVEVTRRRGRRRKQLLDDLGDRRGYSHFKEETLDRIKWRNRLEEAVDLSSDRLLMMTLMKGFFAGQFQLKTNKRRSVEPQMPDMITR
jgi:hypothetical protein